jgi:hypothetical protein
LKPLPLRAALIALLAISAPALPAAPAAAATRAFHEQMAAWNRGDLEAALALYWNSVQMTWVNRAGLETGIATFAQAMRAQYAANPQRMGQFTGAVLKAMPIDARHALLVVRWSIDVDGANRMGGISSQLWKRTPRGWKIIFEHAG